ncbi:hypothetical protein ACLBWX_07130 [Methylobacterium sp. M6A4_1b]
MKAFILAVIAAVGLGVAAMYVLTSNQKFAYQAFATSGARVSEPGTNLVGEKWTGDPRTDDTGESAHGKATGEPSHPKRS